MAFNPILIISLIIINIFIWLYSGFTFFSLILDNNNISFNLPVIILFPLIYWISEFESKINNNYYLYLLLFIFILLIISFIMNSLFLSSIYHECLIILLFLILFIFIPSFHRIRTAFFSFLFPILGSIHFILSLYYIVFSIPLFPLLVILPSLIKIPTFPSHYWLPEVHCEANTPIPLSLAGLLLKSSIFGIIRFILRTSYLPLRSLSSIFIYTILLGIIIINGSYFRYYDLKKTIALSPILHLNLTFYSILSSNSAGIYCGIVISLSHSLSSIGLSLFSGLLINKTFTRLLDAFFSISSILRLILLFILSSNNSFPSSINYIGEPSVLLAIISIDSIVSSFFLLISLLSTLFRFIVLNRKLPYNKYNILFNFIFIYYILLLRLLLNSYLLGIYWLY